ncbi:hypothetical protein BGLA2_2290007 [Burkholderia gladioli]|nr:hypothetical protein BGLA2_2290007 [Burkholderia gladioli]
MAGHFPTPVPTLILFVSFRAFY